jgi:hypothetical protein
MKFPKKILNLKGKNFIIDEILVQFIMKILLNLNLKF